MGKGDRKTFRGKTYRSSYGKVRPHAVARTVAGGKPTAVKPAVHKPTPAKPAAPRAAAAKPAAPKAAAAKKPAPKKKTT